MKLTPKQLAEIRESAEVACKWQVAWIQMMGRILHLPAGVRSYLCKVSPRKVITLLDKLETKALIKEIGELPDKVRRDKFRTMSDWDRGFESCVNTFSEKLQAKLKEHGYG